MGMVFQSYSLFPNMTARENVAFGLRMRKVPSQERAPGPSSSSSWWGWPPKRPSSPTRCPAASSRAWPWRGPWRSSRAVLLLDEPLSALDAKVRVQLREQIRVLQTRLEITTLFVTHDQEEALSMADRVCVMRAGRIEQVDPPSTLYSAPATPFVAEFVGTMNRIPGVSPGPRAPPGHRGRHPPVGRRSRRHPSSATPVDVLVRPEGLAVVPSDHGRGSS